jgi:hypothetical protein
MLDQLLTAREGAEHLLALVHRDTELRDGGGEFETCREREGRGRWRRDVSVV